jgi:signal transduction histidine kinase
MDAETLARAAEPFFTTKPVGQGSGFGLAMVQGFAEQSGGRLVIESEPGRGTRVAIWLPAADGGTR